MGTENRLCYICSPYRGEVKRNKEYAREMTRYAMERGFLPVTVHLYLTEATDDSIPEERSLGMSTGMGILRECSYIMVGNRYGISEGMAAEIRRAAEDGIEIIVIADEGKRIEAEDFAFLKTTLTDYGYKRKAQRQREA